MLKRFIKYYKPHKGLLILDLGVAALASCLTIFLPWLTRDLLKVYIPAKEFDAIITILVIMLGIYLIKTVLVFIRIKWGHILGARMESDMREDIFRHIQKLSFNYFDNVKSSHLMSRISNDLNRIAEVAHHAPEDLFISFCVIIGAFIFMFSFNTLLALISLIPLPFMLLWGWFYGGSMRNGFRETRKKIADINDRVKNAVQGIREVKAFANEGHEINRFAETNNRFLSIKEGVYGIMASFFSGMNFLREFYYLVIIVTGVILIYTGSLEVYDLLAFILYVSIILPPIDKLVNFTEQFNQGLAAFERFIEVMDIEPDIEDHKNARPLNAVKGEIKLNNINFKYNGSPDWILKNINISVAPGENVALVGESGAGKSTIVSLIPRFYEPHKGEISIDGMPIKQATQKSLRRNIGIVQQNVFLFDGTIRENIIYGRPGASEAELITAAKQANIYDFIQSLPEAFESQVGEQGVKLSGGQKQRISIARVFLKNPPILIFDEATSALDTESENLIKESMEILSRGRTTITIAHRLSTVKNAGKIYVLKKGRIVEEGTHQELVELGNYYHSLYTNSLL